MSNKDNEGEKIQTSITIGVIAAWFFGVMFFFSGSSFLVTGGVVPGIIFLILSVLLLPPFWNKIHEKTNITLSSGAKVLLVIIGIIAAGAFTDTEAMRTNLENSNIPDEQTTAADKSEQKAQLQLLSHNSKGSGIGFVHVQGEVKNISDEKLESVQAVVRTYDKEGDFITSDSGFIEYDPILPNQTSPFKVLVQHNPEMDKYTIEFKEYLGGQIGVKRGVGNSENNDQ